MAKDRNNLVSGMLNDANTGPPRDKRIVEAQAAVWAGHMRLANLRVSGPPIDESAFDIYGDSEPQSFVDKTRWVLDGRVTRLEFYLLATVLAVLVVAL